MTWDQFKQAVEAAGVKPDDEIDYIDIGGDFDPNSLDVKQIELAGERHFSVVN